MVKEKIRLRYSGLILFASRLLSVATGMIFTIIVARSTSIGEFGIWNNLADVLSYFTLMAAIVPFWITRFTAREYEGSAKTGIIANVLMSTVFAFFFVALVPTIMSILNILSDYTTLYTIAAIQILEMYTLPALEAVLHAKKPQMIGYGFFIFEVCKVSIGFALVIEFKLGLMGAISSIIIAYALQLAFYFKLLANELKGAIRWTYLKEWLKASPINLYNLAGTKIAAFVLILLFAYRGDLARGYYGAALNIAAVIGYSSYLAFALYPRLLSGSKTEDISISLKMVMMFAIPMSAGIMVLSESYLTILKAVFAEARLVLILLAINYLLLSISGVFSAIVSGTERVDAKAKIAFRELVKSRLFLLFTLPYIESMVTLPTTFFVLTSISKTPLEAATYLAIIILLTSSAMLIVRYLIARKCLVFHFPWKSASKYALASGIMVTALLVIPQPTRISITAAFTLLGAAIYLTVLTLIDKETRSLARSIIREARHRVKISKTQEFE